MQDDDDEIRNDHHLLIIHHHHLLRGAVTMLVDSKEQVVPEELLKMQGSVFLAQQRGNCIYRALKSQVKLFKQSKVMTVRVLSIG